MRHRAIPLLLAAALGISAGGCKSREAGLLVTVTGSVLDIAKLHVTVTSDLSGRVEETDILAPAAAGTFALPVTFTVVLEATRRRAREGALSGPFTVCVTAMDSGDTLLASACGTEDVEPDEVTEYTIELAGGGSDSGIDGGFCGNGVAEGTEACDGGDLRAEQCETLGLGSGTLQCGPMCIFDTAGCNGPPTVPVLRRPMNGAYVGNVHAPGTLRPTFAWEPSLAAGGASVTYDVQYSTDPTFPAPGSTTETVSFPSHAPLADLPVSLTAPVGARYYWRVRACAGASCSAYSGAWYFNAGRSRHDVNGDGYGDAAIGAPFNDAAASNAGAVSLFLGGPGGSFDETPDFTFGGTAGSSFGGALAMADLDGDGFADIAIGASRDDTAGVDAGAVYLFFGSGLGPSTTADLMLAGVTGEELGVSVSASGDIDGDGSADLVAGAWRNAAMGADAGAAHVYLGGASRDASADLSIYGTAAGEELGSAVALVGDLNGDGFGDWAVGVPGSDAGGGDAGRAFVFMGGPALDDVPDGAMNGETTGDRFGSTLAGAGDANGDGFADLAVGAPLYDAQRGRVYVYLGAAGAMFDPIADGTLTGIAADDYFGDGLGAGGDLNGDGLADVVVGAPLNDAGGMGAGRVYVFHGVLGSAFDPGADVTLTGAAGDSLGAAVSNAADLDGDGLDDLTAGAPTNDLAGVNAGAAFVFLNLPSDTAADGIPAGEASADGFGSALAR